VGSNASVTKRGLRKWIVAGTACLALIYLALSIPERTPNQWVGAGKEPFAWNRNAFWPALENEFARGRSNSCESIGKTIEIGLADSDRILVSADRGADEPGSAAWEELESHIFELAPLVAVCPKYVSQFSRIVSQTRSMAKRASQNWNLDTVEARQRLYRLLTGARMALEEVLLQTPSQYFFNVLPGDNEPSATPGTQILGVEVHSGDILVSRGGAPTSALIARGNDYPGTFSHVALVHVDEKTGKASVIESHIERGVAVASLEDYLRDVKLRIMVLRLRQDLPALQKDLMLPHKAATLCLNEARTGHIAYDFEMDYHDHRAQFCSEVASAAYERVGIQLWMGLSHISSTTVAAWLGSLGVCHFETQEPSDLEYDPQLRVVAEWRDPEALMKAHVDDAVTDAMLMNAPAGAPLTYNPAMLPVTRVAKGYSLLLNLMGKIGPVPEGMSATTALRVKAYRTAHSVTAAKVVARAAAFKTKAGYSPPYWRLVELAGESLKEN
jgi:hypothetical protein